MACLLDTEKHNSAWTVDRQAKIRARHLPNRSLKNHFYINPLDRSKWTVSYSGSQAPALDDYNCKSFSPGPNSNIQTEVYVGPKR